MVPAAVRMPRRYLKLRSLSVSSSPSSVTRAASTTTRTARRLCAGLLVDGSVTRDGGAKPLVLAGDGLPVQLQNRLVRVIELAGGCRDG